MISQACTGIHPLLQQRASFLELPHYMQLCLVHEPCRGRVILIENCKNGVGYMLRMRHSVSDCISCRIWQVIESQRDRPGRCDAIGIRAAEGVKNWSAATTTRAGPANFMTTPRPTLRLLWAATTVRKARGRALDRRFRCHRTLHCSEVLASSPAEGLIWTTVSSREFRCNSDQASPRTAP